MAMWKVTKGPGEGQAGANAWPVRMVTVQDLASLLHVHPNTVRHWSDAGLLKSYRIGPRRDRRFSWEDIRHFLHDWGKTTNLGNQHNARVLIIDDDNRIRGLLRDIVEEQGCEAVSVESGERALQELERRDFDLIFLDLVLPGLDGVEVLRAIEGKGNNAVVAVATGYGDEPIALEAMSLGPLILIRKPLDTVDVTGIVQLAMSAKQYRAMST